MPTFHASGAGGGSPRVHWEEWGSAAFARAEREGKPLLMHIGAVWCHWCHVMDETTYQDEQVVSLVNERFVPLRVDNDRRPDVNRRYNMGGWPSTVFLTPTGRVLTGATYVPPKEMRRLCSQVLEFWQESGDKVKTEPFRGKAEEAEEGEGLSRSLLDQVVKAVAEDFDAKYGGFGRQPKFPQVAALELSLDRFIRTADQASGRIVAATLRAMAGGGMYDPVEGGFFRYSTTRDWSVPHFEKMLEDNARLLELYAKAYAATGDEAYSRTVRDVLRFWNEVLRNPDTPFLAGSQDADEEYYALPLEERRRREAPFVDRTVYTDWNALAAQALLRAGTVLGDRDLVGWGVDLVRALDRDLRGAKGQMAHFRSWKDGVFAGEGELAGLLGDQVEMIIALLAVYGETRDGWTFRRALELAEYLESNLAAEGGGYYDGPPAPDALGALKLRVRPMDENARAAQALMQLYELTGRREFEDRARDALQTQSAGLERYRSMAAPFGLALDHLLAPVHTVVVGPLSGSGADATRRLAEVARRFPLTASSVAVQDTSGENPHQPETTYPVGAEPAAYVCEGAACLAPAATGEELAGRLREAAGVTVP